MAPLFWGVAVFAMAGMVAAMLADHRRTRRSDPDAVGIVDWRSVQIFAFAAAVIAASVALHS